jgi:hypothetical protein
MLARELDGIPAHATEIVREKLNYIEMILHGGSTSIRDVSGGAPGSGKGGVANH